MHVKKKTRILIFGIMVVIMGIIIGIIPIFVNIEKKKIENIIIDDFINNLEDYNYEESEDKIIMALEIPKVNLRKGIYPLGSSLNSIEYNVAIMEESSMPDTINGNLVLAAHNGNAEIAYFNELHKLGIGDKAYIYYKGFKYEYTVNKIYDVKKDGDVEINRDSERNTLTLVTCKRNTDYKQLVIILYLSNKEVYP